MPGILANCGICARTIGARDGMAFLDDGYFAHVPCYTDGDGASSLSERSSPAFLRNIHVLVVEDNPEILDLLKSTFEYSGAFVTSADSATLGKRLLRELTPHVIVTDISMPDDGLAMVAEVLAFSRELGSKIPAIAITAARDGVGDLRSAGFSAFIAKPLDPFVLTVVAERLVRASRT